MMVIITLEVFKILTTIKFQTLKLKNLGTLLYNRF